MERKINRNTEIISDTHKEVCYWNRRRKSNYMLLSRYQNAGQSSCKDS